jgi:hypothetical protein
MKKLTLILTFFSLTLTLNLSAQVDSFHYQIKDTLLTKDTKHTFNFTVRESIADAAALQYCIYYDPVNLAYDAIDSVFIPGMVANLDFEINPGGNQDKISSVFYNFPTPYTGHKLFNIRFKVLNNCRVRDVIRIMPIYRFNDNSSYFESVVILNSGESVPIATEYFPFKSSAVHAQPMVQSARTYPNPLTSVSQLQFTSSHGTNGRITIYDMAGRSVYSSDIKVTEGENKLPLQRSLFPVSGLYQVMITTDKALFASRLLVE